MPVVKSQNIASYKSCQALYLVDIRRKCPNKQYFQNIGRALEKRYFIDESPTLSAVITVIIIDGCILRVTELTKDFQCGILYVTVFRDSVS